MTTLNLQVSSGLAKGLNMLVQKGVFENETIAIDEAITLLMKRYKLGLVKDKILKGREKISMSKVSLTREIIMSHEEEDL